MKSKWALSLAFVVVFALGVLAGTAFFSGVGREVVERRAAGMNVQQNWRRISQELNLTPEQRQRIRAVLAETVMERQAMLRETRKLDRTLEERILAELNPEQRDRFTQLRSRMREREQRMKQWLRDQRRDEPGDAPKP